MFKPLTPSLILQRTKTNNYSEIKSINLWGQDLDDITMISRLVNLEVAQLANNRITTLVDIAKCHSLTQLNLRKNKISNKEELQFLEQLPNLKVLSLCDNPIDSIADFRETIVNYCPQLEILDEVAVTDAERRKASDLFSVIILDPKREVDLDSFNSLLPSQISDHQEIELKVESDQKNQFQIIQKRIQKEIDERICEEKSTKQQFRKTKGKQKNARKESEKTGKILSNGEKQFNGQSNGINTIHFENLPNNNDDYVLCSIFCLLKKLDNNQKRILKKQVDAILDKDTI